MAQCQNRSPQTMSSRLWLVLFSVVNLVAASTPRPNIVLIVADDLGWSDVGFHGGDVSTPNLDALAYNSINLRRHYSQPICSPSRTALLTGDYPIRHGMQGLPCLPGMVDGLPVDIKLMPEYFKELGYRTHLVGKWHLGYETWEHMPTRRGFDSFFGFLNGYLGYWDGTHYYNGKAGLDIRRQETGIWEEVYGHYLSEVLTREAVRVIDEHPRNESFLLILSQAEVHATRLNAEREAPDTLTNHTRRGMLREKARYLDKSVGEVVSALAKGNILNNTILVFFSDNGAPTVESDLANFGSNWPFRGQKVSCHEGGVRTSALIYSALLPGRPRVTDQLFHITDWLPTLFRAAGGEVQNLKSKDGIDQWQSLASGTHGPRNELLVNIDEVANTEAYVFGRWKLIKNLPGKGATDGYTGMPPEWTEYDAAAVSSSDVGRALGLPQDWSELREELKLEAGSCRAHHSQDCHNRYCLFDLQEDPRECQDVADWEPKILKAMHSQLQKYRAVLVDQAPKNYMEEADPKLRNGYWGPWMHSEKDETNNNNVDKLKDELKKTIGCIQSVINSH